LFKDEQNVDLESSSSDNPVLVQRMYRPKDMIDYVTGDGTTGKKRNVQVAPSAYQKRRQLLVDHFHYQNQNKAWFWPNRGPAGFVRRRLFPFDLNHDALDYDMDNC
jgi:hypothetical protein